MAETLQIPIQHKYQQTSTYPDDLMKGETAFNTANGKVYLGDGTNQQKLVDGTVYGSPSTSNMGWQEYYLDPTLLAAILETKMVWQRTTIGTPQNLTQGNHNKRRVLVQAVVDVNLNGSTVDDGFRCKLLNATAEAINLTVSASTISFGPSSIPGGQGAGLYYDGNTSTWTVELFGYVEPTP